MQFNANLPIYLQIAELMSDQIIAEQFADKARLPSVRELAIELEVNPNTVVRAYSYLEQNDIVYKQRGIGFFTTERAKTLLIESRKKLFLEQTLPKLKKKMMQLGLSYKDLEQYL